MTAPEGVAARLDGLEALHAAATPGVWRVRWQCPEGSHSHDWDEAWIAADHEATVAVLNERYTNSPADAALIVAAANALPDLIAAVRAVAVLADEWRASIHILDEIDRFEVVRGIDAALSALSGRDDHTERQPCGCKSAYVHDHGCTKFASDHTEEAGR